MRRLSPFVALVVVLAALVAAPGAGARTGAAASALDRAVLAQINKLRAAHGLAALTLSRQLDAAASQHSHEMVTRGYFSHDSADGSSFSTRIRHYYPSKGHAHWSVGENLLWASPTISAVDALKAWIASPPHLHNLLSSRWREIGVSAVHAASAPGFYQGQAVTVITTDFGVRR